jgi:predicted XRE-type DNA-binding protein
MNIKQEALNTASRGKTTSPLLAEYEERVKTEIRVLLAQKNLSQKTVAYALERAGIKESSKGLSAKLSSGKFSAAHYLALKDVIGSL